ncbi:MAG: 1,4-dihydroxy-6-naphthoate synthase [Candidatus Omnitrophota bacterium]|jgi:1,4-dihydroxy-6-naphthoate synthase
MKKNKSEVEISFGYTPDPDDAFHYYALEHNKLSQAREFKMHFLKNHIQTLNEMALRNELDVTAISSVLYPQIRDKYVILASGSSVGRGYGPVLGAKAGSGIQDLAGKKVAIPGIYTTGFFLTNYFYRDFIPVPMEFDEVMAAVLSGEVDAGVFIHEELMNYRVRGIEKICCLGERWFEDTNLPLPVGLTVARRALGMPVLKQLSGLLKDSMTYAMQYPDEAMQYANQYSCEAEMGIRDDFVHKFANNDTLSMPEDVRQGLCEVYHRAKMIGLLKEEFEPEIIYA